MKQLNIKKTHFPRFDKILVIQPIAEVYGEGNEQQLCRKNGIEYKHTGLHFDSENPKTCDFLSFS